MVLKFIKAIVHSNRSAKNPDDELIVGRLFERIGVRRQNAKIIWRIIDVRKLQSLLGMLFINKTEVGMQRAFYSRRSALVEQKIFRALCGGLIIAPRGVEESS